MYCMPSWPQFGQWRYLVFSNEKGASPLICRTSAAHIPCNQPAWVTRVAFQSDAAFHNFFTFGSGAILVTCDITGHGDSQGGALEKHVLHDNATHYSPVHKCNCANEHASICDSFIFACVRVAHCVMFQSIT